MNNYMANFHQTHTVSSRDAEQTDKTESTCREKADSPQSGSGD